MLRQDVQSFSRSGAAPRRPRWPRRRPCPPPRRRPATRPRLALALSGGGARGIAHIGALRALEEAGLPVDAIAANSMGAVVGGIYATGRSADELEEIVRSLDWAALFSGRPDRRTLPVARRDDHYADWIGVDFDWKRARLPAGLVAEHRVNRFLIRHLSPAAYAVGGDFDRLAIPFRAVATDLGNGDRVILAKGDLARAVRASMSIPVFFPPVSWEGRKLVDGLVVDNLPTDVAKLFGAAVTVAIDIGSPELEAQDYATSLGVASQVSDLLSRRRSQDFTAEADVYVRPDLGKHSATDYSQFDALIKAGYEATKGSRPADPREARRRWRHGPAPAPEARARAGARGSAHRGGRRARQPSGPRSACCAAPSTSRSAPASRWSAACARFDKIEATGLFDRCWLEFEPAPGGVQDRAARRSDAPPNRAAIGLGYNEWEKARVSIRLRNQDTLGFGEQVELLLAASDAETLAQALAARRPPVRAPAWATASRPTRSPTSRASSTRTATSSIAASSSGRA